MTEPEAPVFVLDSRDPLTPRAPWSFLLEAAARGFDALGWRLLAAWGAFFLLSNVFWAVHLKALTGWSSLPNYWGELLTARDLWELMENGGLKLHWTGPLVPLAAGISLLWFLWAGWRMQTALVQLPPRLGAWAWGLLDALLVGALPLFLVGAGLVSTFAWLGSSGIQGLSWLDWVGGALVRLACVSAFFLQWWLCRLGRARGERGWRMGGWPALGTHLRRSFLGLWQHPVQWSTLVLGGVVVRTGLTFLGLALAWRMGGGSTFRVWAFLVLQLAIVVINAWLLGWFLRLVALYNQHDAMVHAEIRALQSAVGV